METFVGFSLLLLISFLIGEEYGCLLVDWAKDLGGDSWSWGSIEARSFGSRRLLCISLYGIKSQNFFLDH